MGPLIQGRRLRPPTRMRAERYHRVTGSVAPLFRWYFRW
jgi:hypothetical protein